jgi:putative transposase
MLKVVQEGSEANETGASLLDAIVRDGARQMLAAALQAEVAAYVEAHRGEVDSDGRRLVVRNGFHAAREVTTAAGAVPVRQPRVNDKRLDEASGERRRFSSAILPAWSRKSLRVAEVLPLLYLHGLSSSDFGPALAQFLGSDQGLSAATITRLTTQWQDDVRAFNNRSLAGTDYVYVWVDGIHLKVRLEADKVCLLVVIGVRADGRKELVALADGFRESAESWADLLRDAKRRGMTAPVLAVQDRQRLGRPAEVGPPGRETGSGGDLQRRGQDPRPSRRPGVRRRVRRQMAEGRGEDHQRPRRPAGVLRLPGRALDPPPNDQSDRVDLRHRPPSADGHQGPRQPGRRCRDGVQAGRSGPDPLASRERTPPRRSRPRGCPLRQRPADRTTRP